MLCGPVLIGTLNFEKLSQGSLGASDAASVGSDFNAALGRVDSIKSRPPLWLKYAITGKASRSNAAFTRRNEALFLIKTFLWHFQQREQSI